MKWTGDDDFAIFGLFSDIFSLACSRDLASNPNRVDRLLGEEFAPIRDFCQTHFFIFFELFRSCGPMDKASDYESGDSRFESWQDRKF